jgi:hypothetical protein
MDAGMAKQIRVNWSKGDNRAKLEAALSKWKEGACLDENGEVLSAKAFAKWKAFRKAPSINMRVERQS